MSMYGLVFDGAGAHERGGLLLGVLGFTKFSDVGRFRDAWLEKDDAGQPMIAVYTRNGGGNREECWNHDNEPMSETVDSAACECPACKANHFLPAHELWARGVDDEFDSTYRTEYFRVPEKFLADLTPLAGEHVDTSGRWLAAIDAIGGKS